MGSIGALKLLQVMQNVEQILAVEMFTAAQALDFRHPRMPGKGVAAAHNHIRSLVPHGDRDYYFKNDLNTCARIVTDSRLIEVVEAQVGVLN